MSMSITREQAEMYRRERARQVRLDKLTALRRAVNLTGHGADIVLDVSPDGQLHRCRALHLTNSELVGLFGTLIDDCERR